LQPREFRSRVEDLVKAKELKLPSTAGFKLFDLFFSEESVSHPAKANLHLLYFLIKKYTEEGGVVADIMAGTGSTGIVSSYLGRNAVLVELEEKFVEWMEKNVALLESHGKKRGKIKIIQGDARRLVDLLGVKADSIVTSPPYVETKAFHDVEFMERVAGEQSERVRRGEVKGHYMTEKARRRVFERMEKGKSENPSNIGNLPPGEIDAVITSPPYSNIAKTKEGGISPYMQGLISKLSGIPVSEFAHNVEKLKEAVEIAQSKIPFKYSDNPQNIGNLTHGEIDAIVTSPPYSESMTKKRKGYSVYPDLERSREMPQETRDDNIANLNHGDIDAIITSPPYAETTMKKEFKNEDQLENFAKEQYVFKHGRTLEATKRFIKKSWQGYPENPSNIGSLPLKEDIDAIITSPPYEASVSDDKEGPTAGADEKKYGRWQKGTARKQSYTQHDEPCKVDTIITSPPYEASLEGTSRHTRGGIASRDPKLAQSGTFATMMSFGVPVGYTPDKDNIGNLKSDEDEYKALEGKGAPIDAIITSPPYAEANRGGGIAVKGYEGVHGKDERLHLRHDRPLSDNPDNFSNMPFVDSVITSPPYHDEKSDWDRTSRAAKEGEQVAYSDEVGGQRENIGNIHYYDQSEPLSHKYSKAPEGKETYLSAMLACYQQSFQVLKPNGRIIIIVKPFIRGKRPVDLPLHTWLLLEKCGFQLVDVLKFRLPAQSLWRVLQYKKNPDIERISHEYILVCRKS